MEGLPLKVEMKMHSNRMKGYRGLITATVVRLWFYCGEHRICNGWPRTVTVEYNHITEKIIYSRKSGLSYDLVQMLAQSLSELFTRKKVKNPAAVALGRLGGLKGGIARAEKLSSTKRTEIARKAAEARWRK